MVFSSQVFIYHFLGVALLLYYLSPRALKPLTLTLASYSFYGWWKPQFVSLMLLTSVVDYCAGKLIARAHAQGKTGKPVLVASIVFNLGLLGFFKYADFGIGIVNALGLHPGPAPIRLLEIVLPIGISFYTFQSMSYTIDVYRKEIPPARNLLDFISFVSLFPQLVAGPIIRYSLVADQVRNRTHTLDKFVSGVLFFQTGLAKKVLIADLLASLADAAFGSPVLGCADAWVGILAYAFQIYFDFSGYSDMAIGLGLMLGFRFAPNFNSPYRAVSITDFWRRWHMSLSTWLRDYLYVPLGGNRKGKVRTYVNLSLTMLIGGLWHGANWTFVAWGAYQGLWLVIEKALGNRAFYSSIPKPFQILFTFVIVLFGWVFFRAADLPSALGYMGTMLGLGPGGTAPGLDFRPIHALGLALAAITAWGMPTTQDLVHRARTFYVVIAQPTFVLALLHLYYQNYAPFLYYQF